MNSKASFFCWCGSSITGAAALDSCDTPDQLTPNYNFAIKKFLSPSEIHARQRWRRGRDSNSRSTEWTPVFKTGGFNRSPTPPYDRLELYKRWRASVRLLRSRKKFCTVLKAFAMSGLCKRTFARFHSKISIPWPFPQSSINMRSVLSSAPKKTFPLLAIPVKIS